MIKAFPMGLVLSGVAMAVIKSSVRYGEEFDAGGNDRLKQEFTSSTNCPNLQRKKRDQSIVHELVFVCYAILCQSVRASGTEQV
jgi:hypothetical protein